MGENNLNIGQQRFTTNAIMYLPEVPGGTNLAGLDKYPNAHTCYHYFWGMSREVSAGKTGLHMSSGRIDSSGFGIFINEHDGSNVFQNSLVNRTLYPEVLVIVVRHLNGNNMIAVKITLRNATVETFTIGSSYSVNKKQTGEWLENSGLSSSTMAQANPDGGRLAALPARCIFLRWACQEMETVYLPATTSGEPQGQEATAFNFEVNTLVE